MKQRHSAAFLAWTVGTAAAVLLAGKGLAADPRPYLPGLTGPDEAPSGCISCHEGKRSVKAMLDALKHRDMEGKVESVPGDCKACHTPDRDLEALGHVAHSMHYARGSRSEFVTKYGGSCLHCHTLATGSGEVDIKSGRRNW